LEGWTLDDDLIRGQQRAGFKALADLISNRERRVIGTDLAMLRDREIYLWSPKE
jgi:hypothetical protein